MRNELLTILKPSWRYFYGFWYKPFIVVKMFQKMFIKLIKFQNNGHLKILK